MELIQYDEIPTITLYFDQGKTATTPDILIIHSLQSDQLKKATQILFKVGKGDDIPKYCEPTPKTISQAMENVGKSPVVTETGKRKRDKLKNHPNWEEWKESKFHQLDDMDKENMIGTPCIIPPGSIVLRQVCTYVIKHYGNRNPRNTCDGTTLTGKGISCD